LSKKRKSFKQDTPIQNLTGVNMNKTDKPLTRAALVSMQVIDSKGRLLGEVKDLTFEVGKPGISLSVESKSGETRNVPWEEVQGASDFIIVKAQPESNIQDQPKEQTVSGKQESLPLCPTCNQPLTWIPQYKRWYCYNDKKYV
jgi:sporulation protein YlmC with PRC-barrel domain